MAHTFMICLIFIIWCINALAGIVTGSSPNTIGKFPFEEDGLYKNERLHLSKLSQPFKIPSFKSKLPINEYQYHGTTTLAFKWGESILICIDSKASIGNYIGSRNVKKIFPIGKSMVATMAGGAADCAYWIRQIDHFMKILSYRYSTQFGVKTFAKLLSSQLISYRDKELSVGTMIGGVDNTGSKLFYVDSQGTCVENDVFAVGSGSTIAYSVLDEKAKTSGKALCDLERKEAQDLALWAVKQATYRDGYSGGYINLFEVNSTGIFHIQRIDSRKMQLF